jgi:PTH2 family peptidyl-tRNA hydrolase
MSTVQARVQTAWGASAVLLAIGTLAGFFLGRVTAPAAGLQANGVSKNPEGDEDSEDEDQDLNAFAESDEECKLVLVVRTDLGMTKGLYARRYKVRSDDAGKIAAQCSHATLACYKALTRDESKKPYNPNSVLRRWESLGQAKIAVQVKSEEELLVLQAQAMSLGVCAKIIHDAGRTQIASGTATVLGVGPGPRSMVDKITGGLKLL